MVEYQAEVISKKQLSSKIYELNVRLIEPAAMLFTAGQFAILLTPEGEKRFYSMASTPANSSELTFCVDVSPMGIGSKYVLSMQPGDKIVLGPPQGVFTIKNFDKDLLFIATGAGIAPFRSIVKDALANNFPKQITLVFGVRSENDQFYFDEFEELAKKHSNFNFFPTLSQPAGDWQGLRGRVTNFIATYSEQYKNHLVYLCGAPEMVKDCRTLLIEKGFGPLDIKLEIFT